MTWSLMMLAIALHFGVFECSPALNHARLWVDMV